MEQLSLFDENIFTEEFDENGVKARVEYGDIWKLGDHILHCHDSTDISSLKDFKCDLIITDPPYNVNYSSKDTKHRQIANDNLSIDAYKTMLKGVFNNYKKCMNDKCSYYVFAPQGGDNELMMMMMMRESNMKCRHQLIWLKDSFVFSMNRLDYDYMHEPILYGWNKTHGFYADEHKTSILRFNRDLNKYHPTQKPISLIIELINNSSQKGDVVCDFFAGGGERVVSL